nr:RodZ domain-containing protein [Nocardioides daedukensis]
MWGDRVRPIATAGDVVEPLVIDDFAVEPASEPVIGPDIAAARTRIGLSIDALADRTRIRPHVLESIEVDDFHACGGDFYARGHLRTLARVLGLDAAPLLTAYDEKYADAPINARRVFEAELGTGAGGGLRATKGGPNWSLMIAVVMTLVLAWSIARLAMDSPVEIQNPAPILNGSDGPNQTAPMSENVTLKVSSTSSTQLEVRDGNKKVVFDDSVDYGEVHRIDVLPPVRVTAEDAGAIEVEIDGEPRGSLGQDGKEASKSYRAATDKD